jgi:hypothetical protein
MSCCHDLAEKLLEFRDGTLPPDEMEYLREHLHECTRCLYFLNGYDEVLEVVERLQPKKLPPDLLSRMKTCMEDELRDCVGEPLPEKAGDCDEGPGEGPGRPDAATDK